MDFPGGVMEDMQDPPVDPPVLRSRRVSHFFCSSRISGEPGTHLQSLGPLGQRHNCECKKCAWPSSLESSDPSSGAVSGSASRAGDLQNFMCRPKTPWGNTRKITGRTLATATAKCFNSTDVDMSLPRHGTLDLLVVHFKFDHQRVVS